MPLHLLHHKSWHVYNKDNVEKVRRDQENARRKEEEEEMRMNKADQERRLAQLRGNAYGQDDVPTPSAAPEPSPSKKTASVHRAKHVNLFQDEEAAGQSVETNPERDKEVAKENKKWEDMITSKLVNATKEHSPWYSQVDKVAGKERDMSEIEKEEREKKQMKWKGDADPLKKMEQFLSQKREADEREERRREKMEKESTETERRRGRARTPENDEIRERSHKRHHRSREQEQKRHHRRHRSRSRSPRREHRSHRHHRPRSPQINIEQLRAEREKREANEKQKIDKLMRNNDTNDKYRPVGHAGFSAQFHPEAVRK
jgi:hypothetical protein